MLWFTVAAICHKFSAAACVINAPSAAIRPLINAALSLQPSLAHYTPVHAECMRMCLVAKTYFAAQPILDQELLQVDKETTSLAPRDLLLFHYYAGMLQIGVKRFKTAIQYLTLCFSAPTQVLNVIMIEAYKKFVLCSLLEPDSIFNREEAQFQGREVVTACRSRVDRRPPGHAPNRVALR